MNEKLDFQNQSGVNFSEIKTGIRTGVISSINLELISVRLKLEDEQVGCEQIANISYGDICDLDWSGFNFIEIIDSAVGRNVSWILFHYLWIKKRATFLLVTPSFYISPWLIL